jgi:hypothetical protein
MAKDKSPEVGLQKSREHMSDLLGLLPFFMRMISAGNASQLFIGQNFQI